MMLTPEELAALAAYHEGCKGKAYRFEDEILASAGVSMPLSRNAHSAIAKLLQREMAEQSGSHANAITVAVDAALGEVARQQGGIVEPVATEARGEGIRAGTSYLVSSAIAIAWEPIRVAIARDGHEGRTTKYYEKLLGYCICVHCAKLPDWERIIETNDRTTP